MISFNKVVVLAFALFSVAPALAQKPATPVRGRPNHAALYGYPHGRGDHSGVRQPAPPPGKPMTPGGYVDPRAANNGAQCRYGT